MTDLLEAPDGSDHEARPTIPARYVVEMLAEADVDRRAVLADAAIPSGALGHPGYRVTGEQTARLHQAVVRATGDELYGAFRRPVPRGTYVTLVRLATGFRYVRGVFDAAQDIYALFDGGHEHWSLEVVDDRARLVLHPRSAAQRGSLLFAHAMLLTPWRTASWLARTPFALRSLTLHERFAGFGAESRYLFGVDPVFDEGPSAVTFDASVLGWPIRRTRQEVEPWARTASFGAMIERAPRDSVEAAVRRALASPSRPRGDKLPDVARHLGMSPPTLTRRLRELGVTFQQIKDATRRDHAIAALSRGATVAAVAEALGYSEPSSFSRAFKAWTGLTPGHFREGR